MSDANISDVDWARSNPDACKLFKYFYLGSMDPNPVALLIRPLRNLVEIATLRFELGTAVIEEYKYEAEGFFNSAVDDLMLYHQGIPATIDKMIESLRGLKDRILAESPRLPQRL